MDATDNTPAGVGAAVPGNQPEDDAASPEHDERKTLEKELVRAAETGDKLRFDAAVSRFGDLEEARRVVRERAVVRSIDRVASWDGEAPEVRETEARSAEPDAEVSEERVMFGHFSKFNEWTEIDSWFEGRFLERIAPGAYKKTFRENRANIKSLFQHGHDPVIGDKPLGPIDDLREDDVGAYYEVPLLDAPYVRDIEPGLREGLYGASFRFKSMREEFSEEPGKSKHNPEGLPERTLKELRVYEFGPVTFPAYPGATAGLRSADTSAGSPAPSTETPTSVTSPPERRDNREKQFTDREEFLSWLTSQP